MVWHVQVLRGRLTPGDLIVFLTYLKNTFRPVRSYAKYTARLAKATAAGERVIEILDEVPGVRDAPDARPAPAFQGAITFEDVRFGYAAAPVLRGISVDIAPGSKVAIIGPSGTGKSTFASLILRLYDPTEGRVLIDGHDIGAFTLKSLRAQTSLVVQETLIFRGSVAENIALGAAVKSAAARSRLPPGRPTRTASSWQCRTATILRLQSAAPTSQPASASASPSPAPCCARVRS
jgi:ATP-binding cassette, subfamily B, bacterial